jgi:hypothetical protein
MCFPKYANCCERYLGQQQHCVLPAGAQTGRSWRNAKRHILKMSLIPSLMGAVSVIASPTDRHRMYLSDNSLVVTRRTTAFCSTLLLVVPAILSRARNGRFGINFRSVSWKACLSGRPGPCGQPREKCTLCHTTTWLVGSSVIMHYASIWKLHGTTSLRSRCITWFGWLT